MAARKAASVFPEPVGAAISVFRRCFIAGQASACGAVAEGKLFENQRPTAGWKISRFIGEENYIPGKPKLHT